MCIKLRENNFTLITLESKLPKTPHTLSALHMFHEGLHELWSHLWTWGRVLKSHAFRPQTQGNFIRGSMSCGACRGWGSLSWDLKQWLSEEHDHSHGTWCPSRAFKCLVGEGVILGCLASTMPYRPYHQTGSTPRVMVVVVVVEAVSRGEWTALVLSLVPFSLPWL